MGMKRIIVYMSIAFIVLYGVCFLVMFRTAWKHTESEFYNYGHELVERFERIALGEDSFEPWESSVRYKWDDNYSFDDLVRQYSYQNEYNKYMAFYDENYNSVCETGIFIGIEFEDDESEDDAEREDTEYLINHFYSVWLDWDTLASAKIDIVEDTVSEDEMSNIEILDYAQIGAIKRIEFDIEGDDIIIKNITFDGNVCTDVLLTLDDSSGEYVYDDDLFYEYYPNEPGWFLISNMDDFYSMDTYMIENWQDDIYQSLYEKSKELHEYEYFSGKGRHLEYSSEVNDYDDVFAYVYDTGEPMTTSLYGSEAYIYTAVFSKDDKAYGMTFWMTRNSVSETFGSDLFKSSLKGQTFLFAVVWLLALIVAQRLVRRKNILDDAQKAFISAAAHELKTPIAIIENQCELVLENIAPERNTEYVESVLEEANRMDGLVRAMLTYNRLAMLGDGSLKSLKNAGINIVELDIRDILEKEVAKYRKTAGEKGLVLNADISDIREGTWGNPELVALVMDNFLSNAVKYTESGGRIDVLLCEKKSVPYFSVKNTPGAQLAEWEITEIWNPFYRRDKARNSADNSSGMGLPVSRQILEVHGFKYGCNNTDGGLEFWVSFSKRRGL